MKKVTAFISLTCIVLIVSCKKDFLQIPPPAQISPSQVSSLNGINSLLTSTYASLEAYGNNWVFGDCSSDDAYYGGDYAHLFEKHIVFPTNGDLESRWTNLFNGISRANEVLRTLATTSGLDSAAVRNIRAQAKFLRAFYYFELRITYKNVPFIDEKAINTYLPNTVEIWPRIEGDLNAAINDLPASQSDKGRVNLWAAKSLLAKTYLFQAKFSQAKTLLTDIIANGMTSDGQKYGLDANFRDAFDVKTKNSKESVFAVQHSVSTASNNQNSAQGEAFGHPIINGVLLGYANRKPTINLGNAFITDPNGLPLLTGSGDTLKTDDHVAFTDPTYRNDSTIRLDPRLDWTIGRRGIPYLDYGNAPGVAVWAGGFVNLFGPYWPVKSVLYKADLATYAQASQSIFDAHNYNVIRFADVLLWAAECEVEVGSLSQALVYVNTVRSRAQTTATVKRIDASGLPTNQNAANYTVGLYLSFPDQNYGRTAVRFERRLELGMEGHRFFDLVRWGIADQVINAYITAEARSTLTLSGGLFVKGKNEYFPIPQAEINNSYVNGKPTLIQNPGYR